MNLGTILNFISIGSKKATLLPQYSKIISCSKSISTISVNIDHFVLG